MNLYVIRIQAADHISVACDLSLMLFLCILRSSDKFTA